MTCRFSGREKNSKTSSTDRRRNCSRSRTYVLTGFKLHPWLIYQPRFHNPGNAGRSCGNNLNQRLDPSAVGAALIAIDRRRRPLAKVMKPMSKWKINLPGLVILSCIIFLMLLIVVLPDVDLPDAAFHNGTAPVVVHAHATSAPAPVVVSATCPIFGLDLCSARSQSAARMFHPHASKFPPDLSPLHSLLARPACFRCPRASVLQFHNARHIHRES